MAVKRLLGGGRRPHPSAAATAAGAFATSNAGIGSFSRNELLLGTWRKKINL
jgi:hypothetical protein